MLASVYFLGLCIVHSLHCNVNVFTVYECMHLVLELTCSLMLVRERKCICLIGQLMSRRAKCIKSSGACETVRTCPVGVRGTVSEDESETVISYKQVTLSTVTATASKSRRKSS